MKRAFLAGLAGLLIAPGTSSANPLKSIYTTLELKSCKPTQRRADGRTWLCPGLDGYPVRVADGDQHSFVSIGRNAERHRAATQTVKPLNTIFNGKSGRATIEWRFVRKSGKPVPFATILRYFTTGPLEKGQTLVVTRIAPAESCHVAYVDAIANPGAIAIARRVADDTARSFDCRREPTIEGSGKP